MIIYVHLKRKAFDTIKIFPYGMKGGGIFMAKIKKKIYIYIYLYTYIK